MSSGFLVVRFPNGDLRYGIYYGTVDLAYSALTENPDFDWGDFRLNGLRTPTRPIEPVEIATGYGGGMWWRGEADRTALASGLDPFNEVTDLDEIHDGLPEWWPYPAL